MSTGNLATESREVSNFDRVFLRDYGELVITQGEEESLTIETDRDILPQIKTEVREGKLIIKIGGSWMDKLGHAFSTSLTRHAIKYNLAVRKLTGLEIAGVVSVKASDIETDRLALKVSGKVGEQRIAISGAGSYKASKLESARVSVNLTGAGQATVRAIENLDVAIRGIGSVEYYGSPTVKKSVSGIGSITSLGNS